MLLIYLVYNICKTSGDWHWIATTICLAAVYIVYIPFGWLLKEEIFWWLALTVVQMFFCLAHWIFTLKYWTASKELLEKVGKAKETSNTAYLVAEFAVFGLIIANAVLYIATFTLETPTVARTTAALIMQLIFPIVNFGILAVIMHRFWSNISVAQQKFSTCWFILHVVVMLFQMGNCFTVVLTTNRIIRSA
jgi:hypothetical protein